MNLDQLRNIENLSVRAYNVCINSNLKSFELILNWYKKYGNFKKLRNCGSNTNDELVLICIKYIDYETGSLTDDKESELSLENAVSVRAYNVCVYNNLSTVESLIDYFAKYGSFSKFRNCGLKTNLELVAFCKETIESRLKGNQCNVVAPKTFLIENFSRLQLRVIRNHGYLLRRSLTYRAYKALKDFLGCGAVISIEDVFEKIINNSEFSLRNFNYLGVGEVGSLAYYVNSYKDTVQFVNEISAKEELVNLNFRLTLNSEFTNCSLEKKIKLNSIFCAIKVALDKELLFNKNVLSVFKDKFKIYNDANIGLSNRNNNLSKERIRQISKYIQEVLLKKIGFVNKLIDESLDNYDFFEDSDIIFIDQRINEKINSVNETEFSKEWNSYLIYLYYRFSYQLVGLVEDVLFRKNNKTSGRHNWNFFYVINEEISDCFDFVLFVNDLNLFLDSSAEENDCFNLSEYINNKLDESNIDCVPRILKISKFIIKHEFGLEFEPDDILLLTRKNYVPLYKCVLNVLNKYGSPMSVSEIASMVLELYPKRVITEKQIRSVLKPIYGFVSIGRGSAFGLIQWGKEFVDFNRSTIRGLVVDFLTIEGGPRHIDTVTDFVRKFRPDTYPRSVWDNLRTDTSGVFIFGKNRFVGLKSFTVDESSRLLNEYQPEKVKIWQKSFSDLVDFVSENNRLPRSSGSPLTEIQIYRWLSIQVRRMNLGELDQIKSNQIKNVVDEFRISGRQKRFSITKGVDNYDSIIFDILSECPGQIASKEFLQTELVKISKIDEQLGSKILNKAPFLKRRLCLVGRPFYYYHTNSDILDISRDYNNLQDFIMSNLKRADNRLEFYYRLLQKMIEVPNPEVITGAVSRLIYLKEVSQFYHKFLDNDSEILMANRTEVILDNLVMGICESMANRRDISFFMDKEVYNNQFVIDFVNYLLRCGIVRLNMNELKVEIVYLINYVGNKILLENNLEALFLPFVLKDYFVANKLKCEFIVFGFNVKYNNRFNLISYE
jgi:hypothetical protein